MMDEMWTELEEFPGYFLSDMGRVMKEVDASIMSTSFTQQGDEKVGMWKEGKQHTRSIRVLVAKTYLEPPPPQYDTPIHLDGDPQNNKASNLMWRPRWFAIQYKQQFDHELKPSWFHGAVWNVITNVRYENLVQAVMGDGVLFKDVLKSINEGYKIFPNGGIYSRDEPM